MTNCPLISYGKDYCYEVQCMGENCMLWSETQNTCLVRLALLKYTIDAPGSEKQILEEKMRRLEAQIAATSLGFPIYPFGGGKTEQN